MPRVAHVVLPSFIPELRMFAYSDVLCRTTVLVIGGHYFLVLKPSVLLTTLSATLCFNSITSLSAMLGSEFIFLN